MTTTLGRSYSGLMLADSSALRVWENRRREFIESGAAGEAFGSLLKACEVESVCNPEPTGLAGGKAFAKVLQSAEDFTGPKYAMNGAVAVVNIDGPILSNPDWIDILTGGIGAELVNAAIRAAGSNVDARVVALRMNTPGGSHAAIATIQDAVALVTASGKRVVCLIDASAYSLGMAIACMCQEIVVVPGGMAGSIGCIVAAVDDSRAWEMEGLEPKPSASPEGKLRAAAGMPVTKEEMAMNQRVADLAMAEFAGLVGKARGMSVKDVMGLNAAYFMGADVVENKLADRVVASGEAYMAELNRRYAAQPAGTNTGTSAAGGPRKGTTMTEQELAAKKSELETREAALAAKEAAAAAAKTPTPASFAELKAAFAGKVGGAEFMVECLDKGLSMSEAHASWAERCSLRAEKAEKDAAEAAKNAAKGSGGGGGGAIPFRPGAHAGNGGSGAAGREAGAGGGGEDPCAAMSYMQVVAHLRTQEKMTVDQAVIAAAERYPDKRNQYANQVQDNAARAPRPKGEFKRDAVEA